MVLARTLYKRLAAARQNVDKAKLGVLEAQGNLEKWLSDGNRSGDGAADFTALYYDFNPEAYTYLSNLVKKAKSNIGNAVLYFTEYKHERGNKYSRSSASIIKNVMSQPKNISVHIEGRLGRLTGPLGFHVKEEYIEFPTETELPTSIEMMLNKSKHSHAYWDLNGAWRYGKDKKLMGGKLDLRRESNSIHLVKKDLSIFESRKNNIILPIFSSSIRKAILFGDDARKYFEGIGRLDIYLQTMGKGK